MELRTVRSPASLAVAFLVSCAAAGTDIAPQVGDFAFLEVQLRG